MEVYNKGLSFHQGFTKDYIQEKEQALSFVDYPSNDEKGYEKRVKELQLRKFHRNQLASYFTSVHKNLAHYDAASVQIEKLKRDDAVVVVGGQQAGLLTGPLYTLYKAMSVILLAREQEKKLKVPVVPIFWVAGEDHDIDEIRYVYKEKNSTWEKQLFPKPTKVTSASNVKLNESELQKWIHRVFSTLPETAYTEQLYTKTKQLASQSKTYVHFFKRMMNWFLGKEGLLLLDSHAPEIRKIEVSYFETLIDQVELIQKNQSEGENAFFEAGYGKPIHTEKNNAHLFLEINEERRRLNYENGKFIVDSTNETFTKEELIHLLHNEPERFSNNVVTRPLMQEWLLPVLIFVSGPGELSYWATLKQAFHHFHLSMPPIVLRFEATFVPAHVRKWLSQQSYNIADFLTGEMEALRDDWLSKKNEFPVAEVIRRTKERIYEEHAQVRELAKKMDPTLAKLSEKNATIIENQLSFMERKMDVFIHERYANELEKFTSANRWLYPLERPQERVIHPLLLFNLVGMERFHSFLNEKNLSDSSHFLIYL